MYVSISIRNDLTGIRSRATKTSPSYIGGLRISIRYGHCKSQYFQLIIPEKLNKQNALTTFIQDIQGNFK